MMNPAEAYLLKQPQHFKEILFYLIDVVQHEVPASQMLFKWGIPYFYLHNKPLCYLAPNAKKNFVDLGFAKGFQLHTNLDYLIGEKRNTVKSLRYFSLDTVPHEILQAVLKEAAALY